MINLKQNALLDILLVIFSKHPLHFQVLLHKHHYFHTHLFTASMTPVTMSMIGTNI